MEGNVSLSRFEDLELENVAFDVGVIAWHEEWEEWGDSGGEVGCLVGT